MRRPRPRTRHILIRHGIFLREPWEHLLLSVVVTERLHIDYAKEAYRATNKKDFMEQMVIWLTRIEKINQHIIHVNWRLGLEVSTPEPTLHLRLTKNPSSIATIATLKTSYHALSFTSSLCSYLRRFAPPPTSPSYNTFTTTLDHLDNLRISFPVWHRIRITNCSIQDAEGISDRADAVHAVPNRQNPKTKAVLSERFDTALIDEKGAADVAGLSGKYNALVHDFSLSHAGQPLIY